MPSNLDRSNIKEVYFFLQIEEKKRFKQICKSYQLSMQRVLRECVLNIIQEENKKYHDMMVDLFEAPYTDPEAMHLLDEEIENIYELLEQEASEEE